MVKPKTGGPAVKKWIMPSWMEPYRHLIGGNGQKVEVLMNTTGEQANVFNNAPLALICVEVKGQVALLTRLYEAGLLGQ